MCSVLKFGGEEEEEGTKIFFTTFEVRISDIVEDTVYVSICVRTFNLVTNTSHYANFYLIKDHKICVL